MHVVVQHFRSSVEDPTFDARYGAFYVVVEGQLAANAGFFGPPDEASEVEIGYSVCQLHRRQGIATAAIAELCDRAAPLGCRSVRASVRRANVGSIKALQHNGFEQSDQRSADGLVVLRRFLR